MDMLIEIHQNANKTKSSPKMGLRGEGAILSALRLIFKSSAFEPPFSPWGRQARMPEGERPKRIRKMRHRAFTKV